MKIIRIKAPGEYTFTEPSIILNPKRLRTAWGHSGYFVPIFGMTDDYKMYAITKLSKWVALPASFTFYDCQ